MSGKHIFKGDDTDSYDEFMMSNENRRRSQSFSHEDNESGHASAKRRNRTDGYLRDVASQRGDKDLV